MTAFGADVTRAQFIKLTFALCLGTIVEWYEFTVYTQLSNVITRAFFPPNNPTTAQLSFWAVYAVGYLARPLGALVFGHIGDAYGRRLTLLISVLLITLPTLLIGCLPTYEHIGLAAPVIMALLRFIQGIAVGGEFGSAITYLYELAPVGHKGLMASLGQMAVSPGMILGILVCQVVLYGCNPEQLRVWGWRIPFLVTVFTSPLALYMRMHMPEPYEFLKDKQQNVLQRVASTAAKRVAHSFIAQQHSSQSAVSGFSRQDFLRNLSAIRLSSLSASTAGLPAHGTTATTNKGVLGRQHDEAGAGTSSLRQLSARQLSLQLQRSCSITADGRLVSDIGSSKQRLGQDQTGPQPLGCEEEFEREVGSLTGAIKTHVPIAVLFSKHWRGVLLQFLLEACYGVAFYTIFTWMPSYIARAMHVPASNTLWALLIALVLFAITVPLAGHFIGDTKVPKVWALLTVVCVIGAVVMPVMVVLHTSHAVGMWLLMPIMLGLTGLMGGCMTIIGPQIYPPAVRATGYNLGHNLAMSVFGGLCPLVISALSQVMHPPTLAAGVVIMLSVVLSWIGGVGLIKTVPGANAPCPAGEHVAFLERQEQQRLQGLQLQAVTVR